MEAFSNLFLGLSKYWNDDKKQQLQNTVEL